MSYKYDAKDEFEIYVEDRVVYKTKAISAEDALNFWIDMEGVPTLSAAADLYNVPLFEIAAKKVESRSSAEHRPNLYPVK